jgi:hypothetical protein
VRTQLLHHPLSLSPVTGRSFHDSSLVAIFASLPIKTSHLQFFSELDAFLPDLALAAHGNRQRVDSDTGKVLLLLNFNVCPGLLTLVRSRSPLLRCFSPQSTARWRCLFHRCSCHLAVHSSRLILPGYLPAIIVAAPSINGQTSDLLLLNHDLFLEF